MEVSMKGALINLEKENLLKNLTSNNFMEYNLNNLNCKDEMNHDNGIKNDDKKSHELNENSFFKEKCLSQSKDNKKDIKTSTNSGNIETDSKIKREPEIQFSADFKDFDIYNKSENNFKNFKQKRFCNINLNF